MAIPRPHRHPFHMHISAVLSLLLVLSLAGFVDAQSPQHSSTIGDFSTDSWALFRPVAINALGQIVGSGATNCREEHWYGNERPHVVCDYYPVLWDDGRMISLGTLGGTFGEAFAINDQGQVIGSSNTFTGEPHPFLWQDGIMTDLASQGCQNCSPAAINNKGQIAGQGSMGAFLWQNGVMTDLGTLGGTFVDVHAINDEGQVVGFSTLRGETEVHAFLWQNGVMTDLGTLGGTASYAYDINDKGQVVGENMLDGMDRHAFLWQNGVMTDLGTNCGRFSTAYAINNKGQIVGECYGPALWHNGSITHLPGGEDHDYARDINDQGQIIGSFLWTLPSLTITPFLPPSPSPTTPPQPEASQVFIPLVVR